MKFEAKLELQRFFEDTHVLAPHSSSRSESLLPCPQKLENFTMRFTALSSTSKPFAAPPASPITEEAAPTWRARLVSRASRLGKKLAVRHLIANPRLFLEISASFLSRIHDPAPNATKSRQDAFLPGQGVLPMPNLLAKNL